MRAVGRWFKSTDKIMAILLIFYSIGLPLWDVWEGSGRDK
jgi:hypothetical protein